MAEKNGEALTALCRQVAKEPRPALVADAKGRICYRNRAYTALIRRQRTLLPLLSGADGKGAALILRPVRDALMLLWLDPLVKGFRRVVFLRDLTETELTLFQRVLKRTGRESFAEFGKIGAAESGKEEKGGAGDLSLLLCQRRSVPEEDLLEMHSFLGAAQKVCPEAEFVWEEAELAEKEVWTTPDLRSLFVGLAQTVRLFCGSTPFTVAAKALRNKVSLSFLFPDELDLAGALSALFSKGEEVEPDRALGLFPLLNAIGQCREKDIPFRFDSRGGTGRFEVILPTGRALPAFFMGGRGRRRRRIL